MRFVRAPQTTRPALIAARRMNGLGPVGIAMVATTFESMGEFSLLATKRSQLAQSDGERRKDAAEIASVAASAMDRLRHSCRTANHNSPTPGPILVDRGTAHAAGQRMPATIAAAMSSCTLPREHPAKRLCKDQGGR